MTITILIIVLIALACINLAVAIKRKSDGSANNVQNEKLLNIDADISKIDSLIRDEFGRNRSENQQAFKENREELNNSFKLLSDNLTKNVTGLSDAQKNQFDTFSKQLTELIKTFDDKTKNLQEQLEKSAKDNRLEQSTSLKSFEDKFTQNVKDFNDLQKQKFEDLVLKQDTIKKETEGKLKEIRETVEGKLTTLQEDNSKKLEELIKTFDDKTKNLQEQLEKSAKDNRLEQSTSLKSFEDKFTQNVKDFNDLQKQKFEDLVLKQDTIKKETEEKLKEIRETVEGKLTTLQEDNNKKLEEMRKTVDEKLQETVEKRFNESFKLISNRLEEVHKGLGEMQNLASDVGGLKKVLTNVKTRGTFGEVQLESLLNQIFSPDQYDTQYPVKNGQERVDAVVKLPGQTDDNTVLLLPIDSKFSTEDYQRLLDGYESCESKETILGRRKKFEDSVKVTAKSIASKYINPPVTTDFAIMFVPSESIYAEILHSVELVETLRNELHITIVGPTNLAAFLSSLQMGFRTLAIQKCTSEVWTVLGAVKTEFGNFGTVLEKTRKKLIEATNVIDKAGVKSRAIERKLRTVEELPHEKAIEILGEAIEIEQDDNNDTNDRKDL
jgi:DNA recombination protein RmuC